MPTAVKPTLDAPMLGVAGSFGHAEVVLARQFDELHQLIYATGGIRPTNTAIEEVAKLIFLRLWVTRTENEGLGATALPAKLFSGQLAADDIVDVAKAAFIEANTSPLFGAKQLDGTTQSLWDLDEPFRLSNAAVLQRAVGLVDNIVSDGEKSVSDPLGTAFDAFLSGRYDHSGGLGTFLTPSSIAKAMADIAFSIGSPLAGWDGRSTAILDPYCGTGRFLVAALEAAEDHLHEDAHSALLNHGLAGADQSPSAIAKTAINLMLYGASTPPAFRVDDSVTSTALDRLHGSVPMILTNPPFGGGKYHDREGIRRTVQRIPSLAGKASIDPALACTVRAIDLLAPNGVLGIVLPDGIVDGRQFEELLHRSSDISVVANLSLPTSTFSLSGTVAKTSAVFLRRAEQAERVVLARVDHVGFIRQGGKAAPDPEGTEVPRAVEQVTEALRVTSAEPPVVQVCDKPLVTSITHASLVSLDPNRVDPGAMEAQERLRKSGGVALSEFLRWERKRPQRATHHGLPFVSVLHVDALGIVSWPDAVGYNPTTPGQLADSGEVLVSLLNPSKLRAAVVSSRYSTVICSSEFGVFKPSINPYAILGLLYHPDVQAQLRPLGRGTSSSRRRISPNDVLELIVPSMTPAELARLGSTVEEAMLKIEAGRETLFDTYGIDTSSDAAED